MKRRFGLALVLSVALGAAAGCERRPTAPEAGSATNSSAGTAASPRPTSVASASATQTASGLAASSRATEGALHDWVRAPDIVESERAAAAPRLLSAAPNVTEICCALGLREHLVGRTRYCTYPPEILSVPSIGALNDLNAEYLLQLRPELILVSGASRAIVERLASLSLRYQAIPDVTLADLFAGIRQIGAVTGRAQTAARLVSRIRAELDHVAADCQIVEPQRVLLLTEPLPEPPGQVSAAGPGSFYDDLLRRAGCTNVIPAGRKPFAPVSVEFILSADPDTIIELAPSAAQRPRGDADAVRAWARLGPLRAVRAGRVHVLVGEQYFVLGPRIAQTFAALGEALGARAASPKQAAVGALR